MIKCTFDCVAERVLIDGETNTISLINLLEVFENLEGPTLIQQLAVLFVLTREAPDENVLDCELLVFEGETQRDRYPVTIDFLGALRTRYRINLLGFPIMNIGDISFRLKWGDETFGKWTIPVITRPKVNLPARESK